jgi:hypothetical protein
MTVVSLARWAVAWMLLAAGVTAGAATLRFEYGEINGTFTSGPQFPTLAAVRTSPPPSVPTGERLVSAKVSGFWGTIDYPDSTAPVDVFVDGVLVAQCRTYNPCWKDDNSGQLSWTHTFTADELAHLSMANPKLTVTQIEKGVVRLGLSTLVLETGPPPQVPALSPLALVALLAAVAAAGAVALRRSPRG